MSEDLITIAKDPSDLFNPLQILQAYEQAIDENIISSITDAHGTIVHANKRFCEISKFSSQEIIGQNHRIINSGFHSKEFFRNMWETISKGNVWHREIKNKAKDGAFYWVDTVIVPIKDENEKNTHYLSLRTLITERKRLELEKEEYVSALETLMVMTSYKLKKPLSNVLKQINAYDHENVQEIPFNRNELNQIVESLKLSTLEIEAFTKELTTFVRDIKR